MFKQVAAAKWEPKELAPTVFDFKANEGLVEIEGVYSEPQENLLAFIVSRYG